MTHSFNTSIFSLKKCHFWKIFQPVLYSIYGIIQIIVTRPWRDDVTHHTPHRVEGPRFILLLTGEDLLAAHLQYVRTY